ncbi:cytochrome P460 family protein [Paraburkholderia ginsengisoli]|jgi:hypothetical protein|uniref:Cytochrome P460 family protein n=1 Tax=Paraburkholderia ginsengisoli TaxID=311231 RepID=A0A7T4N728_9BURK|nr:cytochrome P460 family protein [Paraburkholderia ginsengisoli]QQC66445.1 cytochrome P460 family protein [Paraburkholderia ginsengisoli]
MRTIWTTCALAQTAFLLFALPGPAIAQGTQVARSPIYGVTIPEGYRKWEAIAPAEEGAPLDELRLVLGNPAAVKALENSTFPLPDGAVLVKLAYKRMQTSESGTATFPGQPTTVQVMVKDSRRYASTGGWGFGRFVNGQPADLAQHQTCFACHEANVKNRDYVFTRFVP